MISGATFPFSIIASTDNQIAPEAAESNHLSVVKADTDSLEESLSKVLAALKTTETPSEQLVDHLHVVGEMLASLAENHVRRGDSARAEVLYLRAIQILSGTLALDHPIIALARDNLAGLYKARRQYALAESLQRTALADLKHYYGKPHADIAITMCNLADTCMSTGRSEDARILLSDGLTILRELFGKNDPEIGKHIHYYEQAIQHRERALTHARPKRPHHHKP